MTLTLWLWFEMAVDSEAVKNGSDMVICMRRSHLMFTERERRRVVG